MRLLDSLLGRSQPPVEHTPDPLQTLIEIAQTQQDEAWQEINKQRERRGEAPITPPSWDEVLQRAENGKAR